MTSWTKESLQRVILDRIKDARLIAVSNREPYIHEQRAEGITCITPASGLTTAIDPILRASGGTWVAHASGSGDRQMTDRHDCVRVPPENPSYRLRRVWLSKELESDYSYGLANQALWPLCHIAFHRPRFALKDWNSYRKANELFANAVIEEAADEPAIVFVQN